MTKSKKAKGAVKPEMIDDRQDGRLLARGEYADLDGAEVRPKVSKKQCGITIRSQTRVWLCLNEPTIEATHPLYGGRKYKVCVKCREKFAFD